MRPDRREFLTAAGALLAAPHVLRAAGENKGLVAGQPEGAEAGNAVLAAGGPRWSRTTSRRSATT